MACSKYTLRNTGTSRALFNYRRCQDAIWQYEVPLNPGQSKNIWLIDGTYSTISRNIQVTNDGAFPVPVPPPPPQWWIDFNLSLQIIPGSLLFNYILNSTIPVPKDTTVTFTSTFDTFYGDNIVITTGVTINAGSSSGSTLIYFEEQFLGNLTGTQSISISGSTYVDSTITTDQIILDAIVINSDGVLYLSDDYYLDYVIIAPTPSVTATVTPTQTPSQTATPTLTPGLPPSPTPTPGLSSTPTPTPSVTGTQLPPPTPSVTPTQTPVIINPFISKWVTIDDNQSITLPMYETGNYWLSIDWGDGNYVEMLGYDSELRTHTYETAGEYIVTIKGLIEGFNFNLVPSSSQNITEITKWGSLNLGNESSYFFNCTNLILSNVEDFLDLTGTYDLSNMFNSCSSLTTIPYINTWDVSSVTNMSFMFANTNFNDNINGWTVSNVTNMEYMFIGNNSFDQPLSNWNISSVISFSGFMGSKNSFTFSPENLTSIYSNWPFNGIPQSNIDISFGSALYTPLGQTGRDLLTNVFNWNITDGGGTVTGLRLTFDSISNVPVGDAYSVSDWNTFFDLPSYGGEFTSVNVSGNNVILVGGSNITIKNQLFYGNINLIEIVDTSNSVVAFEIEQCFSACGNLTTVDLPALVNGGNENFTNCFSLINVNIPSITSTGDYMFGGCSALQSISLPLMSSVGLGVFNGCSSLQSINIPLATYIGEDAFSGCISLTSFSSDTVTSIGYSSFQFCTGLTEVTLQNVTTISSNAFMDCISLTNLTIPSCTSLGDTTGDDMVFSGITGNTIDLTISSSLLYCDLGEPDGDILYLTGNNEVNLTLIDDSFVSVWTTTGSSESITLPLESGGTYSFNVNWGDGSTEIITTNSAYHTYDNAGTYTVTITGQIEGFNFQLGDGTSVLNITEILQWGSLKLGNNGYYFKGATNLTLTGVTDILDLSTTTNLYETFFICSNLTTINRINEWDVSNVTDLSAMVGLTNFDQDISSWDVSQVQSIERLFYGTPFNHPLSSWTVSAVTTMRSAFLQNLQFNQDISSWDVSNVQNMEQMFYNATSFNQDIGNWNVSGVTDMSYMFNSATAFTQDIGGWNVSNVIDMDFMFFGATSFNQDIGNWNVTNVNNMTAMFANASSFNQDLSHWCVTNIPSEPTDFAAGASSWVLPKPIWGNCNEFISIWQTTSPSESITLPLYNGGNYNFDVNWGDGSNDTITAWNQSGVTHIYTSANTYTVTIIGTIEGFRFNNGGSKTKFTEVLQWGNLKLGDNGGYFYGCSNLVLTGVTDTLYLSENSNFENMFRNCSSLTTINRINEWDMIGAVNLVYMFGDATSFNQNIGNWDMSNAGDTVYMFRNAISFNNGESSSINNWNVSNLIYMGSMFAGASSFNQPIGSWNVSNAENMSNLFIGATLFNQDIGNWDVSSVTNMSNMFDNATYFNNNNSSSISGWSVSNVTNMSYMFVSTPFNQYIGNWNVSKVTDMEGMFNGCGFNQDIGNWNVSGVTHMYAMFGGATSFDKNINSWNVSNVVDMGYMFYGAQLFNQPLSGWNVSNVTNMSYMFQSTPFNQYIGNWNVSKVTNMEGMFDNCGFNQDINDWNVFKVTNMGNMFAGATAFTQDISSWNVSNVTNMDAMFFQSTSFNQDLSHWCVTNIPSLPTDFDTDASSWTGLPGTAPQWGTCP
jgi:surface protein